MNSNKSKSDAATNAINAILIRDMPGYEAVNRAMTPLGLDVGDKQLRNEIIAIVDPAVRAARKRDRMPLTPPA